MAEYQMSLSCEIEARLKAKCDKLADAFIMDDLGRFLCLSLFVSTMGSACPKVCVFAIYFLGKVSFIMFL